jgi:hypothetical protein
MQHRKGYFAADAGVDGQNIEEERQWQEGWGLVETAATWPCRKKVTIFEF